MEDKFNLRRFVEAQRDQIDGVRAELIRGRKCGHWMWFVFPQLRGLGHSWMANLYGISGREEAAAYLGHSTLGPRLIECTQLVNRVDGLSIEQIFGGIDSLKFKSSMTLFAALDGSAPSFTDALAKYFANERDLLTIDLLKKPDPNL
jgi:uncharacterized protein (DUF1810 family)